MSDTGQKWGRSLSTIAVGGAILSAAVFAAFGASADWTGYPEGDRSMRIGEAASLEIGVGASISGPVTFRRADGTVAFRVSAGSLFTFEESLTEY
jgi:hypothetical protein